MINADKMFRVTRDEVFSDFDDNFSATDARYSPIKQ